MIWRLAPVSARPGKLNALTPQSTTHVSIVATVDGFIARTHDSIDWLDHDARKNDYGWAAFRRRRDSMAIERCSFEKVLGFGVDWPAGP